MAADFHGLTRAQLARIGWLTSHEAVVDPHWLTRYAHPAEALRNFVAREDRREGEADRLLSALARLTDAQALEVVAAARDVDDLTRSVPEE